MRMLLVVIACCAACGTAARSPAPPAVRDPLQVRCRTQIDACIALSERTPAPAAPALQASCDRGDADACFALALAYADGRGIAQDVALALALYERACRGGHPIACGMAGNARLTGQGTPIDFAAAFQPTRVAARLAISMPASGAQRSRLAAVSRAIREKRSGTRAAAPCGVHGAQRALERPTTRPDPIARGRAPPEVTGR